MTETLKLRALFERGSVKPGRRTELALMAQALAVGAPLDAQRPRLSVCFVLDASGSMKGTPLVQVQESVHALLDLLAPTDKVGVVAFSQQASVVVEAGELSVEAKRQVRRRVDAITADGQTNLEGGLVLGQRVLGARRDHERQVLVLLSDGEANQGLTAAAALEELAARMRPDISVTTLGYGAKHNPDVLAAVARGGGGQYWFIPDPSEARVEFARAVGAQGDVVAEAVELVLAPGEAVEIAEVIGARPRIAREGLVVPLPDLREGAERVCVARVLVDAPREPQELIAAVVKARFRRAGATEVQTVELPVRLAVVDREPDLVVEAHAAALLARAEVGRAEARAMADRGNFDGAAAILRRHLLLLEAVPGYQKMDGSALSEAVEQLVDEVTAYERRPSGHEYAEFKATQLGVDVAQGAKHMADHKSARVQAWVGHASGQVVKGGEVIVRDRQGAELARLPLSTELTIGRVVGNDIVLAAGNISKRHARLVYRDGKAIVVDLKTTNGTFVNGRRVASPVVLGPDDRVFVGDHILEIHVPDAQGGQKPKP